ncbi:N-acetyltransferase [Clostridium swellfunianum]|uniref:N-acetyltransferase n=1 Tax=Clostridium swellfunianum TaxID=1367462 RepID=UPI00202F6216|nr:N-acetyltransferase [Clostridium swellfunianum]MCM0649067.1 N-acetyltransferase [Clostridium swellfunianum]
MIKKLEVSHIKDIMDIWLKTNITAHSFIPEKYWINNYEVVENEYLPIAQTFIYEEDEEVKAFISIINDSFIGALFVSEKHQGQGVGKKLINYCKDKYASMELCVYKENTNAVNFYKSCSFDIVKEQPNEDSGFTEYVMKWEK